MSFPDYIRGDDLAQLDAILRLVKAAIEATKSQGGSKSKNAEEQAAWRGVIRRMGYSRDQAAELGKLMYDSCN